MLRGKMGTSPTPRLVGYLRALLFMLWGLSDPADPPPTVLIDR